MRSIASGLALCSVLVLIQPTARAQDCPLNVECPSLGNQYELVTSDVFGEDYLPNSGQETLVIDRFDPQFVATLHNVTPANVSLLGVELRVTTVVSQMEVAVTDLSTDCSFQWAWDVNTSLNADPRLGIPNLPIPTIGESDFATILAGGEYSWELGADGGGVQSSAACHGSTEMLEAWIGDDTVELDVYIDANPQFVGCAGSTLELNLQGSIELEVTYRYCVTITEPPVSGCHCNTPSPNYRRPGSLLLFPEFDTREGEFTVITVTNVDCTQQGGETIAVEFVFIDAEGCLEFNKTEFLTPCDTFTFLANELNPDEEQGFVYAFAKQYLGSSSPNGDPISWNHLVGNEMMISGFTFFDYSMNPVAFRSPVSEMGLTDLDGDGYRDLDAQEYEPAPNLITIPRFFGQDEAFENGSAFNSQMILIGLTGGQQFETTACLLYYNDNEEVFSTEWTWSCWDKPYLLDLNFGFGNTWLEENTDNDPDEIFGIPGNHENRESGWICVEGCSATSDQESIDAPAIYAVLVEHVGILGIADLPFECGIRTNGCLIPRGQFGDPDVDTNGDQDVNDDDAVDGDEQ